MISVIFIGRKIILRRFSTLILNTVKPTRWRVCRITRDAISWDYLSSKLFWRFFRGVWGFADIVKVQGFVRFRFAGLATHWFGLRYNQKTSIEGGLDSSLGLTEKTPQKTCPLCSSCPHILDKSSSYVFVDSCSTIWKKLLQRVLSQDLPRDSHVDWIGGWNISPVLGK